MMFAPGTDYNNPNVQQQLDRFHDSSDGGNRSDRWRGKGEGKTAGRQALEQYIKSEGERVAGGDYTRVGNNGYRSRENASRPRPQSRSSRYNPANRYSPYGQNDDVRPQENYVPNPQGFGKDTINRPENNSYGNRAAPPQFNSYRNNYVPQNRSKGFGGLPDVPDYLRGKTNAEKNNDQVWAGGSGGYFDQDGNRVGGDPKTQSRKFQRNDGQAYYDNYVGKNSGQSGNSPAYDPGTNWYGSVNEENVTKYGQYKGWQDYYDNTDASTMSDDDRNRGRGWDNAKKEHEKFINSRKDLPDERSTIAEGEMGKDWYGSVVVGNGQYMNYDNWADFYKRSDRDTWKSHDAQMFQGYKDYQKSLQNKSNNGGGGNNDNKDDEKNGLSIIMGGDNNTVQEAQQDNRMDNIGQNSVFGDNAKVGINNAVQIVNQGSGRNPLANMQLATAYNALNSNALERSKTNIDGASRAGQAIKDGEKYTGSRDIVEKIYNNVGEDQNYWQSSAELYRARSFGDRNKYKVPAWTAPADPEKEADDGKR